MTLFRNKIPAEGWGRVVFHLLFWTYLLVLPFFTWGSTEEGRKHLLQLFPLMLTHIPLFFANSAWLAPRVLRKRGIRPYLWSILGLALAFTVLQVEMKSYLLGRSFWVELQDPLRVIFHVIFVTAVSTGYALTSYLYTQEKAREQEHRERLQSELSFLRSQISPHFIFNVLNSIVYLIRSRSPLAEPVTIKLSDLMRYILYESADAQIPLEKELDYLKNYVELQKIRFEEDVDIRLDIENQPGAQLIEPLLMIPFVENAFKHGVGLIEQPVIDIGVRFDEQSLWFTVRNKVAPGGPGVKDNSSGIGLRNVSRRLELLYPGQHRLEVKREDDWFIIHLHLQFHR